jgi:DNA-directed RNA polymerase subunit M/transcription elongation factor TFIIS
MRRRTIIFQRTQEAKTALLKPQEIKNEEKVEDAPQKGPVLGHKLCPKCGKAKAYYFHVRSCKGP